MTPIQWGPSPPEPESYSATSTGTPAPLSPDVAELVRRVRECRDPSNIRLHMHAQALADACERLAAENAKLLHLLERYNAAVANGNDTSLLFAEASAALKETTK